MGKVSDITEYTVMGPQKQEGSLGRVALGKILVSADISLLSCEMGAHLPAASVRVSRNYICFGRSLRRPEGTRGHGSHSAFSPKWKGSLLTPSPRGCFMIQPGSKIRLGADRGLGEEKEKNELETSGWDFPGGAVDENLPANVGDTGSVPGLGGSHVLRSS